MEGTRCSPDFTAPGKQGLVSSWSPPSQPTFLFVAPESCDSVLNSMPRRAHSLATLVSSVSHSVTTDQAIALEETRPPSQLWCPLMLWSSVL